jgi:hypothetical protein
MCSVWNCHDVAKYIEFYVGELRFNATSTGNVIFQNELYNAIPNVAVWWLLRKLLLAGV